MNPYSLLSARIGIGDPDRLHSQVWKIWAAKNSPDLYIASHLLGGEVKTSVHASGHRNVGLIKEHFDRERLVNPDLPKTRHWDSWIGGWPVIEGLELQYVLRFSASQLRRFPLKLKHANANWLPAPPWGYAIDLGIFFINRNVDLKLNIETGQYGVAVGRLADNRTVALITQLRRDEPFENWETKSEEIAREANRRNITAENMMPGARAIISFNVGPVRGMADVALDSVLKPRAQTSNLALEQMTSSAELVNWRSAMRHKHIGSWSD